MTKQEIINYMYENHVQGDFKIEEMAEDLSQKTGKWIENDNGTWSCNRCLSWIPNEQHYYANFCLYCGARMVDKDG